MNVRCPTCEREIIVPKEYAGKTVTCPGCKNSVPVSVSEQQRGKGFPVFALITLVMGIAVGFICATLMKTPYEERDQSSREIASAAVKARDAELDRLRNENKMLSDELARRRAEMLAFKERAGQVIERMIERTQQEKERAQQELREAQQPKQPAIERQPLAPREPPDILMSEEEWVRMGLPKFADIPSKGTIPLFQGRPSVGDYGGVSFFEIVQVLGPNEMLAEIIDGDIDSPIRIKGFSTKGFVDGQRWLGYMSKRVSNGIVRAEIAIVGTWSYTTTLGSQKTIFAAIPLDLIRSGITRNEFEKLRK